MPLQEGIGFLHRARVLLLFVFFHGNAGKRRASEPAAVRRLTHDDDVIAHFRRFLRDEAVNDFILAHKTDGRRVHQTVRVVRGIENRVSADVRYAERVAVARDPAKDFFRDAPGLIGFQIAETEHVHTADDARAHAHHIAHCAADARGRALKRNDL